MASTGAPCGEKKSGVSGEEKNGDWEVRKEEGKEIKKSKEKGKVEMEENYNLGELFKQDEEQRK